MTVEVGDYLGYWWLPNHPDKKISGTLSISRECIKLTTIGSLSSQGGSTRDRGRISKDKGNSPVQEILVGQTVNGKCITLIQAICEHHETHYSSNPEKSWLDLSRKTYNARLAIVGEKHFLSYDDISFDSSEADFSLLNEWLFEPVFTCKDIYNEEGVLTEFSLEHKHPKTIKFSVPSIESDFRTNHVFSYGSRESIFRWQLSHKSFLRLIPNKPQKLDWHLRKFDSLGSFLMVVTGFPTSYRDFFCYRACGTAKQEFQVYLRRGNRSLDVDYKHPSRMLTNIPLLGIGLEHVLNSWFSKLESLKPSIVLYTATLSMDLGYPEFRLINYTQALEALHRNTSTFRGKYMEDAEYKSIAKQITESIPEILDENHKISLKSRIKYGNDYSQKTRIKELLDDVWEGCLDNFIEDKKLFIKRVIEARNNLTHLSSPFKTVPGLDAFYMAERLKVLLATHLLIQIDIPRENVYQAVNRFAPFSFLKK